ncbi:MAG: glycosyltransferase family 39 protein [Anaerolineae bacterium]|nr:glycosyltransferase family 39 protein [Anaerolineae bacterium]
METRAIIDRKSVFLVIILVVLAVAANVQTLFQFPFIQDVEGTNLSNAWAVSTTGELSPYTYTYEEPPAGSFLLAAWARLTGGFDAFGFSTHSGRALMLICHAVSLAFVYGITRKLTKSDTAAIVAALIFMFSPLTIGYQRRVLLENLMLPSLLGAIYLLVGDRRTLTHYLLSAILFGLAVLTKFAVLGFLPALLLFIRMRSDRYHRGFAVNLWFALAAFLILLFPLYANMKQELFPEGWLFGGDFPHVSLLESLADRGPSNGAFLNFGAGWNTSFQQWTDITNITADPILLYGGLLASVFVLVMAWDKRNRDLRATTYMLFGYLLYVVVAGTVFTVDVIPLLPILAINVGIVAGAVSKLINGHSENILRYGVAVAVTGLLLYPFITFYSNRAQIYNTNQVSDQEQAVQWLLNNTPEDAVIATDNYAFVDLRAGRPNTEHFFRVDTDPEIRYNLLNDNLCNIDYVLSTPQVYSDIQTYGLELMQRTYDNSEVLITYTNNGWPIEIRQVQKTNCTPEEVVLNTAADTP